ncbi:MAG: sugar ABC transporter permease, partial [Chloroflexia bacterium]|nr:sugar ABC transporter permease [Chloroflexia bacterium]
MADLSAPQPSGHQGRSAWPLVLLLPAVIVILAVLVYPIAYGFYLSFFNFQMTLSPDQTFIWFANYRKLFTNPDFLNSMRVTAQFTLMTVAAELVIGLGLALLLML